MFDVGEFVRIEVASGAHAAKWMSGRISAKSGQDVTIEVLHGGQATDAGSSPGDWIITSLGPLLTVRYAFSDNATLITTGVKGYFMDDWATKSILVGAVVYLHYEAAAGSTFIADINLTGTGTLLGTNKVQVDTTEKSSVDAATQPTYNLTVADSPTLLTYGNELQIEVDQAGTGAKGGIAYLKFGRLE